jgi:DNA-binding NtrC family response regulator
VFLRVLESGEISRVGETATRKVDFRLVVATNRDLLAEVDAQRFRRDLYYRLAVVPVHIPPLRERSGDVPLLVDHFVAEAGIRHGVAPRRFASDALTLLQGHGWPGNVRELRNLIESLMLTGGGAVELSDLPDMMRLRPFCGRKHGLTLAEASERDLISQTLRSCNGNVTAAASALGLAKSTVYAKLRRYGIRVSADTAN